ncbi:HD domain-containing protein [Burkholderia lata]|uniref:Metal-dependent phosphohydrolase n=1 Tax=Burkholderia lata (strain ATCC 17760 / DSM 23089 / LMG 22485 / NCIMB 9086 / R18194 / 383) TaxID=482957 RepID=Q39G51_BURL3|nr:HD domain-containing protein [Burkholderia lata]ABB08565.1 metal-dependent phosphohydrolase [Burkholderia lata]
MSRVIAGIPIPDGRIAQSAADLVFTSEPDILYRHSMRVFVFASLIGQRRELEFDAELLYVAALFHDIGLTASYHHSTRRFEVDSADAVRTFLTGHGASADDIADAWHAVALHTTFGVNTYMQPLTVLLAAGVETDLLGLHFDEVRRFEREAVLEAFPRGAGFKDLILEAFAEGMSQRQAMAFGSVGADVLERWDPDYRRTNFCGLVLGSNWKE